MTEPAPVSASPAAPPKALTSTRATGVLYRADLYFAFHTARGVLFLVFYLCFFGWVLAKLSGGGASALASPEAGMVAQYIFDENVVRLFQVRSPTLAAFFIVALTLTPVFATLAGCDQTASDLASKHLRFLIPRTGRASIFLARYLGAATLLAGAQVVATLGAAIVAGLSDSTSTGEVVTFALRIALVLALYSAAWVALYAPITAAIPSPAASALTGIGAYAVLVVVASTMKSQWPASSNVLYVTPGGFKSALLNTDVSPTLMAAAGLAVLIALYLAAGWRIFKGRDA